MISSELARRLHDAGVAWSPRNGDQFWVPDRDLDDRVFTVSDMVVEVRDHPEALQFEIWVDGSLAGFTRYSDRAGVRVFPHTELEEEFSGRGLSNPLIRGALDATRAAGLRVQPLCPAVARFIEKHPDYADLLTD